MLFQICSSSTMSIPSFVLRMLLALLLCIIPHLLSSPVDTKSVDDEYLNDDTFDPNWIHDYDPFNNPPCPNWNPADGCGRTPARTKPSATTPYVSERTTPLSTVSTTPFRTDNKLTCTLEEVQESACLHDGECYAVDLMQTRKAFCQCPEMWIGTRCEQMDGDTYVLSADKVEKASIAAGIVVLIIIVTVLIVYLVIKKRKRRKDRAEANGNANGHAGKALMGSDKETIDSEDAEKCTDV